MRLREGVWFAQKYKKRGDSAEAESPQVMPNTTNHKPQTRHSIANNRSVGAHAITPGAVPAFTEIRS
jgi:hypothetical protein